MSGPEKFDADPLLARKLERLKALLRDYGSVLVAFSGGVDSTFLLKMAADVLGTASHRVAAATAVSPLHPRRETSLAGELADALGVDWFTLETGILESKLFRSNPPDRCYHCKTKLFRCLKEEAAKRGLSRVVDGTNIEDRGDFRPGIRAAREQGVASPLMEAGLNKDDIRTLSRRVRLPTWNKPPVACFASRFAYGEEITREAVEMLDRAEFFLQDAGFDPVRVRKHGPLVRIEVNKEQIAAAAAQAALITGCLRELGFRYVTLDLQGFRSGSMNELLQEEDTEHHGR